MRIYILEDDKIHLSIITEIIDKIKFEKNFKFEVVAFTKLDDFLNKLSGGNNIYFLDIRLKNEKVNGVDVAKSIRKIDFYGHIVFVTAYFDYVNQAIEHKTAFVDYIVKTTNLEKFQKRIYDVLKYILLNRSNKNILNVKLKTETIIVEQDKIQYITTIKTGLRNSKKLKINLIDCEYEFYETLKNILQSLNSDFFQINRSTIVNIKYIKSINHKEKIIVLKNGVVFQLSNKYSLQLDY